MARDGVGLVIYGPKSQKLRALRGVIEFHMLGSVRVVKDAGWPVIESRSHLRVKSPPLDLPDVTDMSSVSESRRGSPFDSQALNKMSNKSMANIECGCPMNKIIISFHSYTGEG